MKKSNWLILILLFALFIGLFTYNEFFKSPSVQKPNYDNEEELPNDNLNDNEQNDDNSNDNNEQEKPIENYVIVLKDFKKGGTTTNNINFYFNIETLNIPIEDIVTMFVYAPNSQIGYDDLICRYYEEMGSINDVTGEIEHSFRYNYKVNRNFLIMFEYENMYFEITTKYETFKTSMYDMSNIEDLINDKYVTDIYFDLVIN